MFVRLVPHTMYLLFVILLDVGVFLLFFFNPNNPFQEWCLGGKSSVTLTWRSRAAAQSHTEKGNTIMRAESLFLSSETDKWVSFLLCLKSENNTCKGQQLGQRVSVCQPVRGKYSLRYFPLLPYIHQQRWPVVFPEHPNNWKSHQKVGLARVSLWKSFCQVSGSTKTQIIETGWETIITSPGLSAVMQLRPTLLFSYFVNMSFAFHWTGWGFTLTNDLLCFSCYRTLCLQCASRKKKWIKNAMQMSKLLHSFRLWRHMYGKWSWRRNADQIWTITQANKHDSVSPENGNPFSLHF